MEVLLFHLERKVGALVDCGWSCRLVVDLVAVYASSRPIPVSVASTASESPQTSEEAKNSCFKSSYKDADYPTHFCISVVASLCVSFTLSVNHDLCWRRILDPCQHTFIREQISMDQHILFDLSNPFSLGLGQIHSGLLTSKSRSVPVLSESCTHCNLGWYVSTTPL